MKALRNANLNKVSSATDKEQQLNSVLENKQGMKKIMAKDNTALKTQNQAPQTMMPENQKKHEENLKILCKARWNCRT